MSAPRTVVVHAVDGKPRSGGTGQSPGDRPSLHLAARQHLGHVKGGISAPPPAVPRQALVRTPGGPERGGRARGPGGTRGCDVITGSLPSPHLAEPLKRFIRKSKQLSRGAMSLTLTSVCPSAVGATVGARAQKMPAGAPGPAPCGSSTQGPSSGASGQGSRKLPGRGTWCSVPRAVAFCFYTGRLEPPCWGLQPWGDG